ncbi:uncharacterized protein N7458_010543 [Penicillium daleae]|uniref:MARVEL domain-containing protein n=1 Tax=Penicillium daleae TaxID=63821 RepID=A0AAD6BZX3_9EURO|nr:uncharacterized protein N7458_010543 [Penicillium daleae]KAJ5439545.1 hypothetical protein N7458_010543 [Penicillium daleae]
MSDHAEILRPFLFSIRLLLWLCAVITMALTAWVVSHVKGYRAVFTLVIAVLTTAFYIPSLFTSCMHRNRGYMLPLDIVFYALWLTAFIFVAQTDNAFGASGCAYFSWTVSNACRRRNSVEAFTFLTLHPHIFSNSFWTFCGLCLETLNIYLYSRDSWATPAITHPEKPNQPGQENDYGTATGTRTERAPAVNGEHTQV